MSKTPTSTTVCNQPFARGRQTPGTYYTIVFRKAETPGPEAIYRVKRALKDCLRSHGLEAVDIRCEPDAVAELTPVPRLDDK